MGAPDLPDTVFLEGPTGERAPLPRDAYLRLTAAGLVSEHAVVDPKPEIVCPAGQVQVGRRQREMVDAVLEAIRVQLGGAITVTEAEYRHDLGVVVVVHASGRHRSEHVVVNVSPVDRGGVNVDR